MYYLTDSDIRVPQCGEERAVWAIIVLQSASRARGCDEPLIARLSLLLDHRAVVIQSCHHWTRQPPSFEFDALWQVLKRIKWRVSTVLWIRTPTSRALLLSSQSGEDSVLGLTRSCGNLIWRGSWHRLGQDVQVAIFKEEEMVREIEDVCIGEVFS